MATNGSLKEHIKVRKAGVREFLSIPVEKESGVQASEGAVEGKISASPVVNGEEKAVYRLGFKAYIQLGLRTGQYRSINVIEVYEGELKAWKPLTEELVIDIESRQSNTVIGYGGYFELLSGFKKCVFWYRSELDKLKESADREDFDYRKAVVKDMLTKWGILSLDLQRAQAAELKEEVLLYKPLFKEEDTYSLELVKEIN